jgi:hypothetical protein
MEGTRVRLWRRGLVTGGATTKRRRGENVDGANWPRGIFIYVRRDVGAKPDRGRGGLSSSLFDNPLESIAYRLRRDHPATYLRCLFDSASVTVSVRVWTSLRSELRVSSIRPSAVPVPIADVAPRPLFSPAFSVVTASSTMF